MLKPKQSSITGPMFFPSVLFLSTRTPVDFPLISVKNRIFEAVRSGNTLLANKGQNDEKRRNMSKRIFDKTQAIWQNCIGR